MRTLALSAAALVCLAAGCAQKPLPASRTPAGIFSVPRTSGEARIWAVGDTDDSASARGVARLIERSRPLLLLYLGDVYESGAPQDFRRFDSAWGALKRRTLPTPGNHDWPAHSQGYDPYWGAVTGRRPPSFYATHAGGWQIVSLDSEEPLDAGSPELRWLRARMRGRGTCRLVFWHRPRYSGGQHGDQADVAPLWNAVRKRAALVLTGHDHHMQQLRPPGATTPLIAGSGGHSLYSVVQDYPRLAWFNDRDYGALRVDLRPGRAQWAFLAEDGRLLRHGRVACRPQSS